MWLQARDKTLIYHNWTKNSRQLNRDTQAQHLSSHCTLFVCIGKKKVFTWFLVLLKVYPQSLKGGEKVVSPTSFSMTQQVLLKKTECHKSSTSYLPESYVNHMCCSNKYLKVKIFIIILWCPPSGPEDHS